MHEFKLVNLLKNVLYQLFQMKNLNLVIKVGLIFKKV